MLSFLYEMVYSARVLLIFCLFVLAPSSPARAALADDCANEVAASCSTIRRGTGQIFSCLDSHWDELGVQCRTSMIKGSLTQKWTGSPAPSWPKILSLCWQMSLLTAVFSLLQLLWPERRQTLLRSDLALDLGYGLLTVLVTRPLVSFAAVMGTLWLASLIGAGSLHLIVWRNPLFAHVPMWGQAVFIVIVTDFVGYWAHRFFHSRWLWPFHAVHHSSTQLDWASNFRIHPVNEALQAIFQIVPFILIGLPFTAILGLAPLFAFIDALAHSNTKFHWGPFDRLIVSPRFHRAHHRRNEPHCNYAPFISLWDQLFGTARFTKSNEREDEVYGAAGVKMTLRSQLIDPFSKSWSQIRRRR